MCPTIKNKILGQKRAQEAILTMDQYPMLESSVVSICSHVPTVSEGLAHILVRPDFRARLKSAADNAQEQQERVPGYKTRVCEGPVYLLLFFTISIYHLDSEPEIFSYIHLRSPNTV